MRPLTELRALHPSFPKGDGGRAKSQRLGAQTVAGRRAVTATDASAAASGTISAARKQQEGFLPGTVIAKFQAAGRTDPIGAETVHVMSMTMDTRSRHDALCCE
jgi:hypothetical protein